MALSRSAAASLLALGLHGAALADAIPPPAELNDSQKALIGVWQEDRCQFPVGLGHSCLSRVFAFGNESASQLYFSELSYSNEFGTSAETGAWTAAKEGENWKISVKRADGKVDDYVIHLESPTAFTLISSDTDRYPSSRFTRWGGAVQK